MSDKQVFSTMDSEALQKSEETFKRFFNTLQEENIKVRDYSLDLPVDDMVTASFDLKSSTKFSNLDRIDIFFELAKTFFGVNDIGGRKLNLNTNGDTIEIKFDGFPKHEE